MSSSVASWPAYRFLKRQVRWSDIPISKSFPQFVVIHTVKGFGIVNKAEVDVFLELSCILNDPTDVGNLKSGSSAFSKTTLNVWKFTVHVLLKPGLENFEHYFTSVWDECNCAVVWAFFGVGLDGPQPLVVMKASSAGFSPTRIRHHSCLHIHRTRRRRVFPEAMFTVLQRIFCFCVCLIILNLFEWKDSKHIVLCLPLPGPQFFNKL